MLSIIVNIHVCVAHWHVPEGTSLMYWGEKLPRNCIFVVSRHSSTFHKCAWRHTVKNLFAKARQMWEPRNHIPRIFLVTETFGCSSRHLRIPYNYVLCPSGIILTSQLFNSGLKSIICKQNKFLYAILVFLLKLKQNDNLHDMFLKKLQFALTWWHILLKFFVWRHTAILFSHGCNYQNKFWLMKWSLKNNFFPIKQSFIRRNHSFLT